MLRIIIIARRIIESHIGVASFDDETGVVWINLWEGFPITAIVYVCVGHYQYGYGVSDEYNNAQELASIIIG